MTLTSEVFVSKQYVSPSSSHLFESIGTFPLNFHGYVTGTILRDDSDYILKVKGGVELC